MSLAGCRRARPHAAGGSGARQRRRRRCRPSRAVTQPRSRWRSSPRSRRCLLPPWFGRRFVCGPLGPGRRGAPRGGAEKCEISLFVLSEEHRQRLARHLGPADRAEGHLLRRCREPRPRETEQKYASGVRRGHAHAVASLRYAIRSLRSFFFFRPANTIFVPLMYFFGASR